ncbi:hypothetical protein AURDEDRAFT_188871 [Auricularia subglabra TFB-10046 SS5]|nr:hypothetical protein AURDEDRAFT_188871 [Auricularia subglabra TFB-10046 SS5]
MSRLYDQSGPQIARTLAIAWCANCLKDSEGRFFSFVRDLRDALPSPENLHARSADVLRHRLAMFTPSVDVDNGTLPTPSMPGASAIERLPFDVLATILLSVSFSTTDRMAICGVSRHFRDTVYDLRLFWTRIHLETERDLDQLDAMLLWSDPAPLHITAGEYRCGDGLQLIPHSSAFDEDLAASLIAPQASRIATLHLILLDTLTMSPLLSCDIVFELLEDLDIRSCFLGHFSLSAPRLKRLVLQQVAPRAWESVISPKLEELTLTAVPPESLTHRSMCKILGSSPALRQMTLYLPTEAAAGALQPQLWPVLNLQHLALELPLTQLVDVVLSLPSASLPYLFMLPVNGLPSYADPLSDGLIRRLLTGVRRLDFVGSDARFLTEGRVHDLSLAADSLAAESILAHAIHLWHLVRVNMAVTSLGAVGVQAGHWDTWAQLFDADPPNIPDMQLMLDITCFSNEGPCSFRTLNCGSLLAVFLGIIPYKHIEYALLERAVLFISSGIILSSQPVVYICICGVIEQQSYCSRCTFEMLKHSFAEHQRGRATGPEWRLCEHER